MQIEEKQIVINGQNITLRSPKKQDAETFSEVRDITYRETYFLARYPEETDFTAEAAEAMISDIAERRERTALWLRGERVVNFATRNPPHGGHRILRSMRGNAALLRLVKLRIEMRLCAARRRERT